MRKPELKAEKVKWNLKNGKNKMEFVSNSFHDFLKKRLDTMIHIYKEMKAQTYQ